MPLSPMEGAQLIYAVAERIYTDVQRAKANKEQCQRLSSRVTTLSKTVQSLVSQLPPEVANPAPALAPGPGAGNTKPGMMGGMGVSHVKKWAGMGIGQMRMNTPTNLWGTPGTPGQGASSTGAPPTQGTPIRNASDGLTGSGGAPAPASPFVYALIDLKDTLEEALAFIQRFMQKKWKHRVFRSDSHKEGFEDIYTKLNEGVAQLSLGLNVAIKQAVEQVAINTAPPVTPATGQTTTPAMGALDTPPSPQTTLTTTQGPTGGLPPIPKARNTAVATTNSQELQALAQKLTNELKVVQQSLKLQEADRQAAEADRRLLLQNIDKIAQQNLDNKYLIQGLSREEAERHGLRTQQLDSMKAEILQALSSQSGKKKPEFSQGLKIPFHELDFDAFITEGSFGKIYRGKWLGEPVVIKLLDGNLTELAR